MHFYSDKSSKKDMNKKQGYATPESRVIELRTEGVIAYSYVNPFDEKENW